MSDYMPTTERVRDTWTNAMSEGCASDDELADAQWDTERRDAQFDRWLAAHDAEALAAERERIIQDMQERSHPDDWGVPCIYIKSYADRLRSKTA